MKLYTFTKNVVCVSSTYLPHTVRMLIGFGLAKSTNLELVGFAALAAVVGYSGNSVGKQSVLNT